MEFAQLSVRYVDMSSAAIVIQLTGLCLCLFFVFFLIITASCMSESPGQQSKPHMVVNMIEKAGAVSGP